MKTEINETATKLAAEHWGYVEQVLRISLNEEQCQLLPAIDFHYNSAMIRGFKHGVGWREGQKDAADLAMDDWEYIGQALRISLNEEQRKRLPVLAFHSMSAFVHGFKHGVEWVKEGKD